MDNPHVTLRLSLLPPGTVRYPVDIVLSAVEYSKEYQPDGSLKPVVKTILTEVVRVGVIDIEKLMTDTSEDDRALIHVGAEIKLPDVVPKQYAMTGITMGMTFVGKKSNFEAEVDAAGDRAAGAVQRFLVKLALACNGTTPFNTGG